MLFGNDQLLGIFSWPPRDDNPRRNEARPSLWICGAPKRDVNVGGTKPQELSL